MLALALVELGDVGVDVADGGDAGDLGDGLGRDAQARGLVGLGPDHQLGAGGGGAGRGSADHVHAAHLALQLVPGSAPARGPFSLARIISTSEPPRSRRR